MGEEEGEIKRPKRKVKEKGDVFYNHKIHDANSVTEKLRFD